MEREKIKNALSKSDLKTLLKITKCYNKDNGLTPIYENCESSIKELRDCGYTVDEVQVQDFAFLTPNRYGGVSGQNELGVDIDTELVPYVEANYTTYANDLHIDDDEPELNVDWLKKNWAKAIGHEARYLNLIRIAESVDKRDEELAKKLYTIAKQYDNNPKSYTYDWAKTEYYNLFRNNKKKQTKVVSVETQNKMKVAAKRGYEEVNGKKVEKYVNLPKEWQEVLTPLIEAEKKDAFEYQLKKLMDQPTDKKDIIKILEKDFKEIFGFEATKENIKSFGYKNEENGDELLNCIKATFEAVVNGKIEYLTAVNFFEKVKTYPGKYLFFSEDWYEKPMTKEEKESSDAKKRQAERKADLETESGNEIIQSKKIDINNKVSVLLKSGKQEWIDYWNNDYQALKNMFKRGEYTEEEFYDELIDTIDYCLEKSGLKKQLVSEKQAKEYEDNIQFIEENLYFSTYGSVSMGFNQFLKTLKYNEQINFAKLVVDAINNRNLTHETISEMGVEESEKFFKLFAKTKDVQEALNILNPKKEDEK